MTDKALSSLQDTGEVDTGALLYVVSGGNSRGIHPGNLQVGLSDGDKGDITVSDTGTVFTIDNDAVSNAKLANMNSYTLKGRNAADTGDPSDIDISALTEKAILTGADLLLILDSAASNAFKKVQESSLRVPMEYILYRSPGTALVGNTGTSYNWSGTAASANTLKFWWDGRISKRAQLVHWWIAWTPNAAATGNNTGIELVYFEASSPGTVVQLAENLSSSTSPITGGAFITTEWNNMLATNPAELNIGHRTKGDGVEAPRIYSSVIAVTWD